MGDVSSWSEASFDELTDVLKSTYSGIQESTDSLEKQLEPLLETWTGAAKESYYDSKRQWEEAQGEVAEIIEQMASAIQDVKEGFTGTESSNAQLFG